MRLLSVIGVVLGVVLVFFSSAEEVTEGIPPLYSTVQGGEVERLDVLWPLYSRTQSEQDKSQRFLWIGFERTLPKQERSRTMLLPFWFSGVTGKGVSYRAFFPLGGTIYDFLMFDQVQFYLWPLYAKTSVNDQKSEMILWPLYSRTQAPDVERLRFFPFYGRSQKEGVERSRFIMWPFYTSVEALSERGGEGFIFFPFYGQIDAPHLQTRWFLPPFFRFSDAPEQRTRYVLWPFIQWAEGTVEKRYLWPVLGRKKVEEDRSGFIAWPLIKWNASGDEKSGGQQVQVAPIYRHRSTWDASRAIYESEWKLWPLASGIRVDKRSVIEVLALWPFERAAVIERNWAPCWRLFRVEKSENEVEWSLLHGLLGYKRSGEQQSWQFCFLRFREAGESSTALK